jgi:hypothetical protein
MAQLAANGERITTAQNELIGKLAEAFARYESNRAIVGNYEGKVLPSLTQSYQAIIRRFQVEPEKVSFNDIVVSQQNLALALQSYLTGLDGLWKAVVDVANIGQLDELYTMPTLPNVQP